MCSSTCFGRPHAHHQELNNCSSSLWFYRWSVVVAVLLVVVGPAVDTVVCAPDDGWRYHPKHVEQFSDKINCVTLRLVGCILEYYYDARTHER
jgi:hypothetical protein